jgi:hypothetical protein
MSFISTADAALVRSPEPVETSPKLHLGDVFLGRRSAGAAIGPTLEIVLLVATSAAVSLVYCTAVAGALLK